MALVVLDASAVIGFLNPTDSLHRRAVAALASCSTDDLVLPASAYAEILVGPYRAGGTAPAIVEQFIGAFGIRVEPLSRDIARRAAVLRAQHPSLKLPDALVLGTADELKVAVLLTGDVSWAKVSASARII